MHKQQPILNLAAYAALSLAGVGSCLLPSQLTTVPLAGNGFVEVPMTRRDQPASIEGPVIAKPVATSASAIDQSDIAGISPVSLVAGVSVTFVDGSGHAGPASDRSHPVVSQDR